MGETLSRMENHTTQSDELARSSNGVVAREPAKPYYEDFLGMTAVIASAPMRSLMSMTEKVAGTNSPVLITGESGTGKELVARALHRFSVRASKPFIDVNCAALPEHLIESELFGYEKGAFSGADSLKPGLFEAAHGGSLFLDEIGELDPRMQAKLLRVLDGQPFFRLGGTRKVEPDVRIIAATNLMLDEAVQSRKFRRDLYHRLETFHLRVPPLRERDGLLAAPRSTGDSRGLCVARQRSRIEECFVQGDPLRLRFRH